jgi:hypothetical protein
MQATSKLRALSEAPRVGTQSSMQAAAARVGGRATARRPPSPISSLTFTHFGVGGSVTASLLYGCQSALAHLGGPGYKVFKNPKSECGLLSIFRHFIFDAFRRKVNTNSSSRPIIHNSRPSLSTPVTSVTVLTLFFERDPMPLFS